MKRLCIDCFKKVVPVKNLDVPNINWECQHCGIGYTEDYFVALNKQGYFIREKDGKILDIN